MKKSIIVGLVILIVMVFSTRAENDNNLNLDQSVLDLQEIVEDISVKLPIAKNRFAYDCALDWFQSNYIGETERILTYGTYQSNLVECHEEHIDKYVDLGLCSEYWVAFLLTIEDQEVGSINDTIMITIYIAEDGSGNYLVTKVNDSWNVFAGDFWSFGQYNKSQTE